MSKKIYNNNKEEIHREKLRRELIHRKVIEDKKSLIWASISEEKIEISLDTDLTEHDMKQIKDLGFELDNDDEGDLGKFFKAQPESISFKFQNTA